MSDEAFDQKDVTKIPKKRLWDFWFDEITKARKRMQDNFFDRAEKTYEVYRGDFYPEGHFNILWANTEVLRGVVYAQAPKPEVQRRYLEKNEVARVAAKVMERGLEYVRDDPNNDMDDVLCRVRDDFLLPGRGIARVRYEPTIEVIGYRKTDEQGNKLPEPYEKIEKKTSEEIIVEYWNWRDFLHSDGQVWSDVWWVAFATNMSKHEVRERYGSETANKLKYCGEVDPENKNKKGDQVYEDLSYARIHEIWDKRSRMVYHLAEGYNEFLEKIEDPYQLENFFPCPPPIDSIFTNNSLIPVPEYALYQDLADELNVITRRIFHLTDALKVRGIYPSDLQSVQGLLEQEENKLYPEENFQKLMAMGGLDNVIQFLPIEKIASAINYLIQLRESTLNTIYQVTGISDILRGATHPRETAAAQRLKGEWGSHRVKIRQKKFEKFIRDLFRLIAELMVEHFDVSTLFVVASVPPGELQQAGMQEVAQLLKDEKLRDFSIKVETDSTIFQDEQREKEDVIEFMTALSAFAPQLAMATKQGMLPPEIGKEIVLAAARRFEFGRELENLLMQWDTEGSQKPDPKEQAEMMKVQNEKMKLQVEQAKNTQTFVAKMMELRLKAQEMISRGEIEQGKMLVNLIEAQINANAMIAQAREGGKND